MFGQVLEMICRPRALNEKVSDNEQSNALNSSLEKDKHQVASIEVQETKAFQEYAEAVTWIAEGKTDEAEAKLRNLWHSELIQNSAANKSAGFSRSILKLRCAIEKNLAPFLSKKGQHSEAVSLYLNVCQHEPNDFPAWYSLGVEGWQSFNLTVAREAFIHARMLNPDNISSLEHLASTFFVLGDYGNCLQILAEILKRKPSDIRCFVLKDEIFRRQSYLRMVGEHLFPSAEPTYSLEYQQRVIIPLDAIAKKFRKTCASLDVDSIAPPDPRHISTLVDLGDALLSIYEWLKEQSMGLVRPVIWTGVWTFPLTQNVRERAHTEESDSACLISPENVESVELECNKSEGSGQLNANGWLDSAGVESSNGSNENTCRDASAAKRRSTRLIPGFRMDDFLVYGPVSSQKVCLRERLTALLPKVLTEAEQDEPMDVLEKINVAPLPDKAIMDAEFLNSESNVEVLRKFVAQCHSKPVVLMLQDFLHLLTEVEGLRWPDRLRHIFLRCYDIWTCHVHDNIQSALDNESVDIVEMQCRIRLLAGELQRSLGILEDVCTSLLNMLNVVDKFQYKYFTIRIINLFLKCEKCTGDWKKTSLFYSRCQESLLIDAEPICLPNSGDVICLERMQSEVKENTVKKLIHLVKEMVSLGNVNSAISLLEKAVPESCNSDSRLIDCQLLLCDCYRQANNPSSCAKTLCKLLAFIAQRYQRINFNEKRTTWSTISSALDIASWLTLENGAGVDELSTTFYRSVAGSLVDFIGFADEYPLYNQDIPDNCWTLPYILLYHIASRIEFLALENVIGLPADHFVAHDHRMLTDSLGILKIAHETLGSRGLCTLQDGVLLDFFAEEILHTLRHPKFINQSLPGADECMLVVEQCFYCLYRYPTKRKRHLEEHDCKPAELTWARGVTVFEFLCPTKLPDFDEPSSSAIMSDLVVMLHRILEVVPAELKADPFLAKWNSFFDGELDSPPHLDSNDTDVVIVGNIYYLIADHLMKSVQLKEAVPYYLRHLTICNQHFNGWSGLGVTSVGILETRLFSLELNYSADDNAFIEYWSRRICVCFERALELNASNTIIRMEHAVAAYCLQSFFSRTVRKNPQVEACERDEKNAKRREFLNCVQRILNSMIEIGLSHLDSKDSWLVYYFLGKVGEKKKIYLGEILLYYFKATYSLYMDGERCPSRIPYKSPMPRGVLERLEVFYRIHVCVQKCLYRGNPSNEEVMLAFCFLRGLHSSPFSMTNEVILDSKIQARETDSFVYRINDTVELFERGLLVIPTSAVEAAAALDAVTLKQTVMNLCRDGFIACIQRFMYHYKAYYRLAFYYYSLAPTPDPALGVELLFGPIESPCLSFSTALFQTRKQGQLFENVWNYSIDDVIRGGSFKEHMYRTMELLVKMFESLENCTALCDLLLFLGKKPESDRAYLLEVDRLSCIAQLQVAIDRLVTRKFTESEDYYNKMCYYVTACRLYLNMAHLAEFNAALWKQRILAMFQLLTGNADAINMNNAILHLRSFVENSNPDANRPWKPFNHPLTKKRAARPVRSVQSRKLKVSGASSSYGYRHCAERSASTSSLISSQDTAFKREYSKAEEI
ncbi:hypothetical protein M513_00770 [Trichuris suis]|uniref:Uncharacterized protein n=1 Tax=Trichuris suis TaxID=68888 RepID=A0A085MMU8_9BILA|nr:hypothetical protein M513_00770 [Trichuris suis]